MGGSESTLSDGDEKNHDNNSNNGDLSANTAGSVTNGKGTHSKHSLKRQKRAKQGAGGGELAAEDGLRRLPGSNNSTPSASTADLLAPIIPAAPGGVSDLSHFGSFAPQPIITTQNDPQNDPNKTANVAFLGRYTPFPPPLATQSAQKMMLQPPSSFSASSTGTSASSKAPEIRSTGADFGVDASTLVVLQDFEAGDSRNPISLRQGDALHLISTDRTGASFEVCLPDAIHEPSASFFIPQSVTMKCRSLDAFPWYHGRVSRAEAERLLSSGIDGTFLVRESESSPGQLSVSLRSGQRVHHYRLTIDAGLWFLSPEWRFRTVPQLVRHHSRHPDGLACPLLYPAPRLSATLRSQTPPVISSGECWELDRTDLRVMRRLGGGQYGEVYEAIWLSRSMKVAVKTLRLDCAMGEREFLQEARVMTNLRHPNLVKLLGVVSRERPFYIVTDFMAHGNLQDFLRARQSRPDSVNMLPIVPVLLRFAVDVASSMQYLESRHFIHRDLAARNCLVTEDLSPGELGFAATGSPNRLIVKVGDFGLARLVGGPSGKGSPADAAYTANATGQFPIKWTAPEGLAYQRFSTKSDVWAFGILLWEIVTYGASPYPSVELSGVYALLERGYRMEQPADCPTDVYQMMRDCWRWEPFERPSFAELKNRLSSILETGEDCHVPHKGDRFYEQLSSMPSQLPPTRHQNTVAAETSTFGQPFAYEVDRPRSGSLSSPSPTKAAITAGANGNIARCRPHNFSFRPNGTSPAKTVATPVETPVVAPAPPLIVPPTAQNQQQPQAQQIGTVAPRSCSGDSLSAANNNEQAQQLSFVLRRGSTNENNNNKQQSADNGSSLLVTQRGYGSLGPSGTSTSSVVTGSTPGVPPKPTDIANRVTAELAEQMRRRRALAEQTVVESPVGAAAAGEKPDVAQKNPPTANLVMLHRHSTDPVAAKPSGGTNTGVIAATIARQQTIPASSSSTSSNVNASSNSANSGGISQPLVSGDGRPVAPVKPCLRRLQGPSPAQTSDYSSTTNVVQPTTSTITNNSSINRPPPAPAAVLMRGPSPTRLNSNNQTSVNPASNNVNWTWDDVHRLCQAVMAGLVDDAMTTSTMGRLPTPLACLLVDLASALDSLADSLPPRSRFQVRQLVIAIRTATSASSAAGASPISSAQISSILNLIPPPSLLTNSTTSSLSNTANNSNSSINASSNVTNSTDSGANSGSKTSSLPNNSSNSNSTNNSATLPAGLLC